MTKVLARKKQSGKICSLEIKEKSKDCDYISVAVDFEKTNIISRKEFNDKFEIVAGEMVDFLDTDTSNLC